MTILGKFLVVGIVLYFLLPHSSNACECKARSVKEQMETADIIFHGNVLSINRSNKYDSLGLIPNKEFSAPSKWRLKMGSFIVKMKINKMIMGKLVSDTIAILMETNDCSYDFLINGEYIVFAYKSGPFLNKVDDGKTFWTNQCTGTTTFSKSFQDEIRQVLNLGKNK